MAKARGLWANQRLAMLSGPMERTRIIIIIIIIIIIKDSERGQHSDDSLLTHHALSIFPPYTSRLWPTSGKPKAYARA